MKTKAHIVLIAGVLALSANAQDFKCEDNYKVLEQKVKEQVYDEAAAVLPGLRKSCPKYNIKLYTLGETVLRYQMESARQEKDRKTFADDLFALYNEQEKNFPGTGGVPKKALLQYQKKLVTNDEAFKMLDAAFESHKASFTDYNVLELYFNLYFERYTKADKGITQEQFIQKISDITGQVAFAKNQWEERRVALQKKRETQILEDDETQFLADAPQTLSALDAVSDNIIRQASKHFSCDKLEAFYSAQYDKNKADSAWLMGMVTVLSATKCTSSATLYTGAQELYKQKPSAQWAMTVGNLALAKDKKAAASYFDEAATLEPDTLKKADIYLAISNTYRNTDKAAAKTYAVKAAEYNPKNGKAYLQLAEMYAAAAAQKDCPLSDFDKKAIYWLAIDTAKKAEAAEPKYKTTVASLIKRYEGKVPTKQDLKSAKKSKGDSITFGCWINESVTVPKL